MKKWVNGAMGVTLQPCYANGAQRLTVVSPLRHCPISVIAPLPHCRITSLRGSQYVTLTLYFRTEVPSLATGTVNFADHASPLVQACDDESMRQVPPSGSFTSTVMGVALWLRNVIAYSRS